MLEATGSVLRMGFVSRKCDLSFLWTWILEYSFHSWCVLPISEQRGSEGFNTRILAADFAHDSMYVPFTSPTLGQSYQSHLQSAALLFSVRYYVLGLADVDQNQAFIAHI